MAAASEPSVIRRPILSAIRPDIRMPSAARKPPNTWIVRNSSIG